VLTETAADLRVVSPDGLSLGVRDVRDLVRDAARAPTSGRWRTLLLTDAERLTEAAANALLKALEEPAARSVFLLCAPSIDDVLPTIRSRCRVVALRTPPAASLAAALVAAGISDELAWLAAAASQGDVERAGRLATDEASRRGRVDVLRLPTRLRRVSDCVAAAADLVTAADADAKAAAADRDEAEAEALRAAFGAGATATGASGKRARAAPSKPSSRAAKTPAGRAMTIRGMAGALKELERAQKSRNRRTVLDSLDRALADLAGWYRDVLVRQFAAPVEAINPDQADVVARMAAASTPEQTLRRLEAVMDCRRALVENPGLVPALTIEALALTLR
jgi:DNA polymerase-3 subunit delta'